MDNMDDPETTAKISDSAYSNSCSNSQSRRSHSSKSTHSGSNSSGSSGYGGKASTSGSSNTLGQPPKKDKESKKKKSSQPDVKAAEVVPDIEPVRPAEPDPILVTPKEETDNVVESAMAIDLPEKTSENMDMDTTCAPVTAEPKEEAQISLQAACKAENYVTSRPPPNSSDGFSCVISMHNGVVLYTSASLTATLGFPKEFWIGRSFIDFVHPKDHKTFASLITNGLALPKLENGKPDKLCNAGAGSSSGSPMVCRIRRYRSLNTAFGVKDCVVTFMPFLLKFFFKDYSDADVKLVYLIVQATPFVSAFKSPNELVPKPVPFVIRHAADGAVEYIDLESVPYMGYLPQDITEKNALNLYHPDDLPYLREVYENIVKEGSVSTCVPYRILAQNGDYIRVETEWSSVINPWSMKLEFVIAKHHIIEGPKNPDVFQSPDPENVPKIDDADNAKIQALRDEILRVMKEVRTKPAEAAKQQMGKRCQELVTFMETLVEETPKQDEELRLDIQDLNNCERDSVMLGGISPHHDSDSKSSIETPLSYNQLNYNENLQRYFDSQQAHCAEIFGTEGITDPALKAIKPPPSSFSPMGQNSNENESSASSAVVLSANSPGPATTDSQQVKLTSSIIHKHNAEMEKELVKMHREWRSNKNDRDKATTESRKKKKEHLARCNATFHPTMAAETVERIHRQGVKRPLKPQYNDEHAQKHHCPSPREQRRRPNPEATSSPSQPAYNITTTVAATQWSQTVQNVNSFNMFGMGMPQQVPMMTHVPTISVASDGQTLPKTGAAATGIAAMPGTSAVAPLSCTSAATIPTGDCMTSPAMEMAPGTAAVAPMPCSSVATVPAVPAYVPQVPAATPLPTVPVIPGIAGMYPMYYNQPGAVTPSTSKQDAFPSTSGYQPYQAPLSYMVHGHPLSMMYGQPFMYSTLNHQMFPMQQSLMAQQTMQYSSALNPFELPASHFEQACITPLPLPTPTRKYAASLKRKKQIDEAKAKAQPEPEKCQGAYKGDKTVTSMGRTTEMAAPSSSTSREKSKTRTSEENQERTDGESSYSSYYSSFFKTDSGSAEDSADPKNKLADPKNRFWTKNVQGEDAMSFQSSNEAADSNSKNDNKRLARRKMDAPWNEEVNLTSELIYKYQIVTKSMDEVLKADKQKIEGMEQPSLVNEQLGQLYLDLQLQGVAARLTLEEGITSSSSSGDENTPSDSKRKREFSKLTIIHEENAPLPAPNSGLLVPEEPTEKEPASPSVNSS